MAKLKSKEGIKEKMGEINLSVADRNFISNHYFRNIDNPMKCGRIISKTEIREELVVLYELLGGMQAPDKRANDPLFKAIVKTIKTNGFEMASNK